MNVRNNCENVDVDIRNTLCSFIPRRVQVSMVHALSRRSTFNVQHLYTCIVLLDLAYNSIVPTTMFGHFCVFRHRLVSSFSHKRRKPASINPQLSIWDAPMSQPWTAILRQFLKPINYNGPDLRRMLSLTIGKPAANTEFLKENHQRENFSDR